MNPDLRAFLRDGFLFVLGGMVLLLPVESGLQLLLERDGHMRRAAANVYRSLTAAGRFNSAATTLYLGDSVAQQLFPIEGELGRSIEHLASMEPISLAGQYYTLERALETHPQVRRVELMLRPQSILNDLASPSADDYFCQYFTELRQALEVFDATHNPALLARHLGHVALPSVFAVIAIMNLRGNANELAPPSVDYDTRPIEVGFQSPVTQRYLPRMRSLAASHGAVFRLLPCPVASSRPVVVAPSIFDASVMTIDQSWFSADMVHLRPERVDNVRAMVSNDWGLQD